MVRVKTSWRKKTVTKLDIKVVVAGSTITIHDHQPISIEGKSPGK
jgi:hypothetical protein